MDLIENQFLGRVRNGPANFFASRFTIIDIKIDFMV
jgi:hypothetical protein